jgi:hypothetical protein
VCADHPEVKKYKYAKNRREIVNMNTETVYRDKKLTIPFENPKHGSPGWRPSVDGVSVEEVVFMGRSLNGVPIGWVTAEVYTSARKQHKLVNYWHYKSNPQLLREKIRGRLRFSELVERTPRYMFA